MGVVSNPKRQATAKKYGADMVVNYKTQNVVEEMKKITKGRGFDVAVEALGQQSTFETCLRCIKTGEAEGEETERQRGEQRKGNAQRNRQREPLGEEKRE